MWVWKAGFEVGFASYQGLSVLLRLLGGSLLTVMLA